MVGGQTIFFYEAESVWAAVGRGASMAFARRPTDYRPPSRSTTISATQPLRSDLTQRSAAERGVDAAAAAAASSLGRPGSAPANVTVDRLFAEGVCAFARGRIDDSEAAFERAAQIAGMSDEPQMRAVEDAATERLRALRADASAVAVEIQAVAAARSRGSSAHRRGEHSEALRQYDKALSQAAQLMWTCRKAGDSPKEQAMQARMVSLLANRAAVHLSLHNFAAAEADSRAVLAAEPHHRVARDNLSAVRRNRTHADADAFMAGERRHTPGSSRGGGAFPRPAPPQPVVPPQRRDPHAAASAAEEHVRAKKAGFSRQVIESEHCDNSERWRHSKSSRSSSTTSNKVPLRSSRSSNAKSGSGNSGDTLAVRKDPSAGRRARQAHERTATTRSGQVIDLEKDFDL